MPTEPQEAPVGFSFKLPGTKVMVHGQPYQNGNWHIITEHEETKEQHEINRSLTPRQALALCEFLIAANNHKQSQALGKEPEKILATLKSKVASIKSLYN